MRIEDRQLDAAGSLQPGRLQATSGAGRSGESARAAAGEDRLELSGLAGRIRDELDTLALRQRQRVEGLAREYQAGRYGVDSAELGRVLLAAAPEL